MELVTTRAKIHNLNNVSIDYRIYQESGFNSPEERDDICHAAHTELADICKKLNAIEKEIKEKRVFCNHLTGFFKTKYLVAELKVCKNEKARQKYCDEHKDDFVILNAAKRFFDSKGLKKRPAARLCRRRWSSLNQMLALVCERESEFAELLTKKSEHDLNRQFRECSWELEWAAQRITKLDRIIQRLYEDDLVGKISDERFVKMTATYEQEQKDLQVRAITLRETIAKAKNQRLNIDFFLTQVKKYTEVKEPDAEIIRALVERIDVLKPEKVPGTRAKRQTILIHWNFIGAVELLQELKKSA